MERLYSDLAHWWPLMSPPEDYVEEAAHLLPLLGEPGGTLLELGCGGGSLAYHLKPHFRLTLTDRSPDMLAVCKQLNPECEHVAGDMTSIDLGRKFDRVLIHDAIMYMTAPESLQAALHTASRHCRTGGILVVLPDYVRETFEPSTDHGGEDGTDGRALRYLEWTWDPAPNDTMAEMLFVFALRESDGQVRIEKDFHSFGLFPRQDWLRWFDAAGFTTTIHHDPWKREVFVGVKR